MHGCVQPRPHFGCVDMAERQQAFQRVPELQRFVLPDVRPTGRQLGVGSYGSVEELEVNGVLCAGKRIHDALLRRDNADVENIQRKYLDECQVMPTSNKFYQKTYKRKSFLVGDGGSAAQTHRTVPWAVFPTRVSTACAGDGAIGQQSG